MSPAPRSPLRGALGRASAGLLCHLRTSRPLLREASFYCSEGRLLLFCLTRLAISPLLSPLICCTTTAGMNIRACLTAWMPSYSHWKGSYARYPLPRAYRLFDYPTFCFIFVLPNRPLVEAIHTLAKGNLKYLSLVWAKTGGRYSFLGEYQRSAIGDETNVREC